MKPSLITLIIVIFSLRACAQKQEKATPEIDVGENCEGCEAVFESPVPFNELNWIDTLPGFDEPGQKLAISGSVFKLDGKTPAAGIVLYVYHTNQKGIYPNKGDENGWGKRHGYLRGWIKTNNSGQYKFYTLIPASYPNSNNPKHIHITIKEPGKNAYWIDDFLFGEDPLLSRELRNKNNFRGGNGILSTSHQKGIMIARRDIILGENIPGYPKE